MCDTSTNYRRSEVTQPMAAIAASMESNNISKNSNKPTEHTAITIDMFKINSNTKVYIDMACQNTANMIIASIKTFIDQNATTQSATINKLNKCIDQCFDQL
ncbi:29460_t:CDS:2 [Gigaspora margarita]|uniref:29460_t:CDS:1 n=1 Tax=Gigaspora margarita TaxID=4874 RepID=A0ABN7UTZ8_GIGMA|nr:29460_t:CDS:2 [Gigaspora margarita]